MICCLNPGVFATKTEMLQASARYRRKALLIRVEIAIVPLAFDMTDSCKARTGEMFGWTSFGEDTARGECQPLQRFRKCSNFRSLSTTFETLTAALIAWRGQQRLYSSVKPKTTAFDKPLSQSRYFITTASGKSLFIPDSARGFWRELVSRLTRLLT